MPETIVSQTDREEDGENSTNQDILTLLLDSNPINTEDFSDINLIFMEI